MAIETSWLNAPQDDSRCELRTDYSILIIDADGNKVELEPQAALNLVEFLSGWRRHMSNAVEKAKEEEADRGADEEQLQEEEERLRRAMDRR